MSEEMKEKEKPKSVAKEYKNIEIDLSEAIKIQEEMLQSGAVKQALEVAKALEPLKQVYDSIQNMAGFNDLIRQYSEIVQSITQSTVWKTMLQYEHEVNKLTKELSGIQRMVDATGRILSMPKFETELSTILPQTNMTIKSLLRHIEFLEKELMKEKAKTAKEKAEKEELLRQLAEQKKELKERYIS